MLLNLLLLWIVVSGLLLILYARSELVASWSEPVLSRPVLVIESDDWGAGPDKQAAVLGEIARILAGFSDREGRSPVMTLGLVMATADGERTLLTGHYQRAQISQSTHGALLEAIGKGIDKGVFSIQLHGMEHFWPPALLAASEVDDSVRDWLRHAPEIPTEELPSELQSRWVNAAELPAHALTKEEASKAVQEEMDAFRAIFGNTPEVVVPPTFIWNRDVEMAWAEAGASVIVTPGCRYETRDAAGLPSGSGKPLHNGQQGEGGTVYMVRDIYFEPSRGHTVKQAVTALASKVQLGRPALFETHRFNFLGPDEINRQALDALQELLREALRKYPGLAFLPTGKLAGILQNREPEWVETRIRSRLHIWIGRLAELPRLRRLACVTGWVVPAWLVWKLSG